MFAYATWRIRAGGGIDVQGSKAQNEKYAHEIARAGKKAEAREACRQRIIDVVTEMGEVSAGRLRSEVGGKPATASAQINALVTDGVLVIGHNGRQTLYRLGAAADPARGRAEGDPS